MLGEKDLKAWRVPRLLCSQPLFWDWGPPSSLSFISSCCSSILSTLSQTEPLPPGSQPSATASRPGELIPSLAAGDLGQFFFLRPHGLMFCALLRHALSDPSFLLCWGPVPQILFQSPARSTGLFSPSVGHFPETAFLSALFQRQSPAIQF